MLEIPPFIFSSAVREFWGTRERQLAAQQARGVTDQGTRGAVTGGQQMAGFVRTIIEVMERVGVDRRSIFVTGSELPGYYRPTKDWDLVVVKDGQLMAAIEFKGQVGSFGNNFNNRTEEALGSALDIWTAYREKAFQASPQPWLGYLFLLEDCDGSRRPVRVFEPHFKVFPEFRGTSYAMRYELLCRRLVLERQYTASCFLMADRTRAGLPDNYVEPAGDFSAGRFIEDLLRHVR